MFRHTVIIHFLVAHKHCLWLFVVLLAVRRGQLQLLITVCAVSNATFTSLDIRQEAHGFHSEQKS